MLPTATTDFILEELARDETATADTLLRLKLEAARRFNTPLIRNDALLKAWRQRLAAGPALACKGGAGRLPPSPRVAQALQLNRQRTRSGVATVTILTQPHACPGRCVYCPTERNVPKSYLSNEPAVMRAIRNDYDPARQIHSRLTALYNTGHPIDKVELIIKGGTWSAYPAEYQQEFIQQCFEATNAFMSSAQANDEWRMMNDETLAEAQRANETATARLVGITIETRPDWISVEEIARLRALGVTRVELGVQTLDEQQLAVTKRGHGIDAVTEATRLLKNAGFKVTYHMMPGLPGWTLGADAAMIHALFTDPRFQPDQLKLYPCSVVKEAELYDWWAAGRYRPYEADELVELLARVKPAIPPYVRIERVIRDIPSTSIVAGSKATNLREAVLRRLQARGERCRCIRCREIRGARPRTMQLERLTYEASEGTELFLSYVEPATDRLAALARLRLPSSAPPLPVLRGAALIRELHTYGPLVPIHEDGSAASQHRGLGQQLMAAAERIAREEFGYRRMAVIAGVGVRAYYRRLGYQLEETYMVKEITKHQIPIIKQ